MREEIINQLDNLLAERRTGGSGWAPVTDNDQERLVKLFQMIIEAKFEDDADGDSPIEFLIVNRNTHQRLHFAALPYPRDAKGDTHSIVRSLRVANMNLGIASTQVQQIVEHLNYEMQRQEDIMSRTKKERDLLRDRAYTSQASGTSYGGQTYEDGLVAVLDWLEDPDIPIEEIV